MIDDGKSLAKFFVVERLGRIFPSTFHRRGAECAENSVFFFLCVLCGREKKCSAGFQPANGPVDAKGVIQAHMPARRRRYDFSSRSATLRVFGCAVFHARPVKTKDFMTVASGNTLL